MLSYAYAKDWRYECSVFRAFATGRDMAREAYKSVKWLGALALLCLSSTGVMLVLRSPWHAAFFMGVGLQLLGIAFWIHRLQAPRLMRMLFSLRREWRGPAPRSVRIEIGEAGIREFDNGIESFCPWEEVASYTPYPTLVWITLSNGLGAIVPRRWLTADSSSVDDLVALFDQRGIKRGTARRV